MEQPPNDPWIPAHRAISEDEPTEIELAASKKLIRFLKDKDCFEPPERTALRATVLEELNEIVKEFIKKVCEKLNHPTEIDGVPVRAFIKPFGSYRLGVCSPSSDIDTLCMTPGFVKKTHFFTILYELLSKNPKVKELMKIEGAFIPIMNMVYDTIEIDISFAPMTGFETIPEDFDFNDDSILEGLDMRTSTAVNGPRTNEMMLKLIPEKSLENFRILLRFTRIWTKAKGLYGNVYGYMGGVNCALLCAFICQRYPTASPATLVLMFFNELAEWPWPRPVYINKPNTGPLESWTQKTGDFEEAMPVITPSYPCINSMRSTTKSTRSRMVSEFKKGGEVTMSIIAEGKKWAKLFTPSDFFRKHSSFMQITAKAGNAQDFMEWSSIISSRVNRLASAIEKLEHVEGACVYPQCFEDESKMSGSYFISLVPKKMSKEEMESRRASDNRKFNDTTQHWLSDIIKHEGRKVQCLVDVKTVSRSNLPLCVFPDGVRPEPKKSKDRKVNVGNE